MKMGGLYLLVIYLNRDKRMRIGALGHLRFPSGYYIYTGRALNNLEGRLQRHRRKKKRLRWHIDYFLRFSKIIKTRTFSAEKLSECELNRMIAELAGARMISKRFGSSDCPCPTHLWYFEQLPDINFNIQTV